MNKLLLIGSLVLVAGSLWFVVASIFRSQPVKLSRLTLAFMGSVYLCVAIANSTFGIRPLYHSMFAIAMYLTALGTFIMSWKRQRPANTRR